MKNNNTFLKKNSTEFIIFSILFLVSFSQFYYHYNFWENNPSRTTNGAFAIFSGDEPHYLEVTSTILRHHSFQIDKWINDPNPDPNLIFPERFYGSGCPLHHSLPAKDGHCYSIHGIGLPLLMVPGYAIGGFFGAAMTILVIFSLTGVIIFKLGTKFASRRSSFLGTIFFCIATVLFVFSSEIYPELATGFFLILVLYWFFYKENNFLYSSAIGSTLGFMLFLKVTYLVFPLILLPIMITVLFKNKTNWRSIFPLIGFFLLFSSLFMVYNIISEDVRGSGIGGFHGDAVISFTQRPLSESVDLLSKGLVNYSFGQSYGLFAFYPLVLLSIFGTKYFWQKNKLIAFTFLSLFTVFFMLHSWGSPYAAAWSLPSRYLVPIIPLMGIPLVLLFEKYFRNIIFQVMLFVSMFIGISANVFLGAIYYSHPTPKLRADIAGKIYHGIEQLFPYVDLNDKTTIENFWSNTTDAFWIFIGSLILLFFLFNIISRIKSKNNKNLRSHLR